MNNKKSFAEICELVSTIVPPKKNISVFLSMSEDERKEYLKNFIETDEDCTKAFAIFYKDGEYYEYETNNIYTIAVRNHNSNGICGNIGFNKHTGMMTYYSDGEYINIKKIGT